MVKDYPRSDRISQQVKKELAQILQNEIKDPALRGLTVLYVEVSHDLKHAKVFIVSNNFDEEIFKGLERSMPFLRTQLSKRMSTRGIPKLHFEYDKTIDESMKISELLSGVLPQSK
jgi:ribosome-binding factor A